MKKWDYPGDDGCLSYPVADSNIAVRVFQTFQKSIDPIKHASISVKIQNPEEETPSFQQRQFEDKNSEVNEKSAREDFLPYIYDQNQIIDEQLPQPLPNTDYYD